jgi:Uma2 family endonuclease
MMTAQVPQVGREDDHLRLVLPRGHLPASIQLAVPLDDDELYELCRRYPDLRIERTPQGALIVMPPTGGETGRRNFVLTTRFGAWVERDGSGVGFDSSTGFLLPNGAERAPDVAWVRNERWLALTDEQRRKFPPLCPDFVIELRSPSDDLDDLQAKMQEYSDNGAALGWLVDPTERRVHVFRPGDPPQVLDDPERVDGGAMLPGFELELRMIW